MPTKSIPDEMPSAKAAWQRIRNELCDIRGVVAILLRQPDSEVSARCKNLIRFVVEPPSTEQAKQLKELRDIASPKPKKK